MPAAASASLSSTPVVEWFAQAIADWMLQVAVPQAMPTIWPLSLMS